MRTWAVWAAVAGLVETACGASGVFPLSPPQGDDTSWRYEAVLSEDARELAVEAWLPPGSLADLVVRRGAERFVADPEIQEEDGWAALPVRAASIHAPQCARGCHLRYRFRLRAAADALSDTDLAIAWGSVIEASPSVWLVHPALAPAGARYRFHVRTSAGAGFATGVFGAEQGRPGTYEAEASSIGVAPYAAFGPMRIRHVEVVEGATLDVAIAPATYAASDDALLAWVTRSARTMARFLGCFPLEHAFVLIVPATGSEVRHGETMGDGGASIVVEVGERASSAALARDWVLPHEMAHLAVPSVSRRHHWLEEGIAVYVQPIARARAGELRPVDVWREFARGMPMGISLRGNLGLDGSSSWARTYWGGAVFCLLADLEIRRRSENRLGFEDALRGVLASGGSVAQIWDFDRLLEIADASLGGPLLRPMHDEIGREPWSIDLGRLFRDLGVIVDGDVVTLSDDAPLAGLRRAITEPLPADAAPPTACRWGAVGRVAQR